jgi:hypothetical protein
MEESQMKESIAIINGHEYKYRWNPDAKEMDYLGPVGEAPSLSEIQFKEALCACHPSDLKNFHFEQFPDITLEWTHKGDNSSIIYYSGEYSVVRGDTSYGFPVEGDLVFGEAACRVSEKEIADEFATDLEGELDSYDLNVSISPKELTFKPGKT